MTPTPSDEDDHHSLGLKCVEIEIVTNRFCLTINVRKVMMKMMKMMMSLVRIVMNVMNLRSICATRKLGNVSAHCIPL